MPIRIEGDIGFISQTKDVQSIQAYKDRQEAERFIREKILWLVPNWGCDRMGKCETCFASHMMQDARKRGYRKADKDFFEKAAALAKLPWKEVIITGGEPTLDTDLLSKTLEMVDPKMPVRIITNGEWILHDQRRRKIMSAVADSGRTVRMEISAHDEPDILKEKIEKLDDTIGYLYDAVYKNLSIGIQVRKQEVDYQKYTSILISLWQQNKFQFIEKRDVLGMGNVVENAGIKGAKTIMLYKLIEYTDRQKNLGVHLMPGRDGVRVVANHQAPYLSAEPTPADIIDPQDSTEEVVKSVINHYAVDQEAGKVFDETAIRYAEAAFRAKIPIQVDSLMDYQYLRRPRSVIDPERRYIELSTGLMDSYYKIISEHSSMSIDKFKEQILGGLSERIFSLIVSGKMMVNRFFTVPQHVAGLTSRDPIELAPIISDRVFDNISNYKDWRDTNQNSAAKSRNAGSYKIFKKELTEYEIFNSLNHLKFTDHLRILGLSENMLAEKVDKLFANNKAGSKSQL